MQYIIFYVNIMTNLNNEYSHRSLNYFALQTLSALSIRPLLRAFKNSPTSSKPTPYLHTAIHTPINLDRRLLHLPPSHTHTFHATSLAQQQT
jgi:hypothetical protein